MYFELEPPSADFPQQTTPVEDGGDSEETGDEDKPRRASSKRRKREAKITNQFNFSERAGQTRNNPSRV